MLNNMGLGFVFTARDLASSGILALERRFASLDTRVGLGAARMTAAFRELGLGVTAFAAGAAAIASGFVLADAAGKFEQGLASVGAVTKATAEQMQVLHDAAIRAGMATQFSPMDAVSGLQSLATAGQTVSQAAATLIPVLDLAAGSLGQLNVAQAAEAVVGTLNAYGIAAEEASGVTDRLLRITQLTNFQTRDFEGGLAKAASSGAVFGQSLDDVLITMGLLRNRNIDASSASTAYRESVRRLAADARAQEAVTGAGIRLFDEQTGKMRSVVDVMSDFSDATRNMTEEERNRRVAVAFGARGLLAFNSVMNASYTTMKDGVETTLMGREAVAAMRAEMAKAGGTAKGFRETLLGTFEGQKTLLGGLWQTFGVLVGEPFTAVYRPFVAAAVSFMEQLLRVLQAIPAPVKTALAWMATGVGVLSGLTGIFVAAKGAAGLLSIAMGALGVTAGGVAAAMAPAVAAAAGFVVLGVALKKAWDADLGGIAARAGKLMDQVCIGFHGLSQLFQNGELSGSVMRELGRAENSGLKRFVIALWQVAWRAGRVWEGLKEGFTGAGSALGPAVAALAETFSSFGKSLGAVWSSLVGIGAAMPSDSFRGFGKAIGVFFGEACALFLRLHRVFVSLWDGVMGGLADAMVFLEPTLGTLREAAGNLLETFGQLFGMGGAGTDTLSALAVGARLLGRTLGVLAGVAARVLALAATSVLDFQSAVVGAVAWLKESFVGLGVWLGETAARVWLFFTETVPSAVRKGFRIAMGIWNAFAALLPMLWDAAERGAISAANRVRKALAPVADFFRGLVEGAAAAIARVFETVRKALSAVPRRFLPEVLIPFVDGGASGTQEAKETPRPPVPGAFGQMPAVAEAESRKAVIQAVTARTQEAQQASGAAQDGRPIQIRLEVDGETLARATHKAEEHRARRGFSPVAVW